MKAHHTASLHLASLTSHISDPACQPVRRFLDMVEPAMEAETERSLTVRAKGASRCKSDAAAIHDLQGRLPCVDHPVDREERVERTFRGRQCDAPRCQQAVADNVTRRTCALTCSSTKPSP